MHADNQPSLDEDATTRVIRDKLDTLLIGQPPNIFTAGVYAQASTDDNLAEVISAVLNRFTMLDHKSSLKANRAYEREGCTHHWKLLNIEVECLRGVVLLLEDLLCSAMCGLYKLRRAWSTGSLVYLQV